MLSNRQKAFNGKKSIQWNNHPDIRIPFDSNGNFNFIKSTF